MKRTKLDDRTLPNYSKGEEIFNMVTHNVGGALAIVAMVLCIIVSAKHKNTYGIFTSIFYGISMINLYTMSSIYHGLSPKLKAKKVFQVLDHCSIFLLIAGTYAPVALCSIRQYNSAMGWIIFGVICAVAILGTVLNSIDLKKYKVFSMICYIIMGWCIIVEAKILPVILTKNGFILLLFGGILYTVGAIFYGLGKNKKWMHSVFHIFIVLGSLMQFLCILLYVL